MKNDTNGEVSLAKQTLRTVLLLVAACVIFVGALSVVAVAVASRVVGGGRSTEAASTETTPGAKKPLSI